VEPESLAFDVGANRGDMTRALLLAGARRVVSVEPQPHLARRLRARFSRGRVSVVERVLSEPGRTNASLHLGDSHVLASVDGDFIERVSAGRFSHHRWTRSLAVRCCTWDALVEAHGRPSFAKIDVEGHEESVLKGMSIPPSRGVCLEVMSELSHRLPAIVGALAERGFRRFNFSQGTEFAIDARDWLGPEDAVEGIGEHLETEGAWGDLYAVSAAVDLTMRSGRSDD